MPEPDRPPASDTALDIAGVVFIILAILIVAFGYLTYLFVVYVLPWLLLTAAIVAAGCLFGEILQRLLVARGRTEPKGEQPVNKNRQESITEILESMAAEKRSTMPAVRPPQHLPARRVRESRGLLARLFDPATALEAHHDLERLKIAIQTETDLMRLDATRALDMKKIQNDAAIEDFRDKADRWQEVTELENAGMAEIIKHQKLRELVNLTAELGLDPLQQEHLIAKLVQIFLAKETNLDVEEP